MKQMNLNPIISVVVIAFNAEKTIRQCMDSLEKQDFPKKNYEVILVNDHSTDKTSIIAQEYKNVKIINQKDNLSGIANARNLGIYNARSDIVAFTDSDCIVPTDWLTRICYFLTNNRQYVAVGGPLKAIRSKEIISRIDGVIGEAYGNVSLLATPNTAYFKSDILKLNLFDTQLITGEDPDLNWRLEENGYRLKFMNNLVVKHQWRSSLKSFIIHHFNYGRGRAQLIKKHPNKYSIFEKRISNGILIILLTLICISLINIYYSFLLTIIFLVLFTFSRRVNLIKKLYRNFNLSIFLISILFLFLIDLFNILGIFYQKLIEKINLKLKFPEKVGN